MLEPAPEPACCSHPLARQVGLDFACLLTESPTLARQFSAQIDRLANLHATAHPPPSASATHALERHRDVLAEYRRDFQRTQVRSLSRWNIDCSHEGNRTDQDECRKTSLRDAEQRANLLGSVREEIRFVSWTLHPIPPGGVL